VIAVNPPPTPPAGSPIAGATHGVATARAVRGIATTHTAPRANTVSQANEYDRVLLRMRIDYSYHAGLVAFWQLAGFRPEMTQN
jgi:hypothetical protein